MLNLENHPGGRRSAGPTRIASRLAGLILLSVAAACAQAQPAVCDARAYGAKADGATKDTAAIQDAIDDCAKRDGGVVRLHGGVFLSGPVRIKSNVTLEIEKGATLLGSSDHRDYPRKTEFQKPGLESLVSAVNASNVAITGGGVIDGAGESWWKMVRAAHDKGIMGEGILRPRLVVFDHCRHILVRGVTLQNSPFWQLVPYYSDGVAIRNVRILAPPDSPNTDAVDPFSSSNVRIDHLYADVGDDNVAIKSGAINSPGPDRPSRNITITNCTFLHGHGLSIGSELAGGAQNITATNIDFKGTAHGIRVKANRDRGNDVSHLTFRNIRMTHVGTAILINEYYPKATPPEGGDRAHSVTRLTPRFHDILIENLTATGSDQAGLIAGLPESPVRNVVLRDVTIRAHRGLTVSNADVSAYHLSIHAEVGQPILRSPNARVIIH